MTRILTVTLSLVALLAVACSGSEKEQEATPVVLAPGVEQVAGTNITIENRSNLALAQNHREIVRKVLEALEEYTGAPEGILDFPIHIVMTEERIPSYIAVGADGVAVEIDDLAKMPPGFKEEDFRSPIGQTTYIAEPQPHVLITVSVGRARERLDRIPGYSLEEAVTFNLFHELWHAIGYPLAEEGVDQTNFTAENIADGFGSAVMNRAQGRSFAENLNHMLQSYDYGIEYSNPFLEDFYRMLPAEGLPFQQQSVTRVGSLREPTRFAF